MSNGDVLKKKNNVVSHFITHATLTLEYYMKETLLMNYGKKTQRPLEILTLDNNFL